MKKIYHLEGVRAIGALIVFVHHFQIIFAPDFYSSFTVILKQYLPVKPSNFIVYFVDLGINGNMFLHIFWGLSAYVIFKRFFEYADQKIFLPSAAVKRYFRLMIPCAVSILLSYFLYRFGFIYVTRIPIHTLQQNLYAFPPSFIHAVRNSVWDTFFDYNYGDSYNGPLWTIEREFYGSLFCFALFGVIGKDNNRFIIYIIIFICVLLLQMYWLNSFLFGYYLSDYDFSELKNLKLKNVAQKVNSYIDRHQLLAFAALAIIYMAGKIILYKHPPKLDAINCFMSALIIFTTIRIVLITRVMSVNVLTKLGKISFGLYVLHYPIMCSISSWAYVIHPDHSRPFILLLLLFTLIISLFLAWIFYLFVDIKSIVWANKIASYISPPKVNRNLTKQTSELAH